MKRLLLACLAFIAAPAFVAPAFAQQSVPEIPFDSVPDFLKLPPGHELRRSPRRRRQLQGPRLRLHALEQRRTVRPMRPAGGAVARVRAEG